jgi:hypothetical protein
MRQAPFPPSASITVADTPSVVNDQNEGGQMKWKSSRSSLSRHYPEGSLP